MVRIIGIVVMLVLLFLAGLSYWLVKHRKNLSFTLKQRNKLTYWFLEMIPLIFGISALMILLFIVI